MIDFPANPTTGQSFQASNGATWIWDGAKWVSGGAGSPVYLPLSGGTMTGPLTLAADPTVPLGAATKQYVDAQNLRYRNRVINGDMSVDQRNGGAAGTTNGVYAIDRWWFNSNLATKGSWQQGGALWPFPNYLSFTSNSAYTIAAGDRFAFQQTIEGCNFNDAQWGTASAQSIVLEFWVDTTVAGTYGGSIRNAASNRSYVFSYTVPTANVLTKFRISIPGDTAGTWSVAANAGACIVSFGFGVGSTYSAAAGAWTAGAFLSPPGAVSIVATNGGFFAITGVALMVGAAASNAEPEFRKFSDNLIDCMRYFTKTSIQGASYQVAGQAIYVPGYFPAIMRATPTSTITANSSSNVTLTPTVTSFTTLNGAYASAVAVATATMVISIVLNADADF
jgi:hypothetical protein